MGDIGRQFGVMFNDIKTALMNIWNDMYSGMSNALGGDETANLFLIAGGALLIIFILLKFINRD